MLKRIEIRNFKAIGDEPIVDAGFTPPKGKEDDYYKNEDGKWYKKKPLILHDLAQVNYLVGKNGSGKSSVLEGLLLVGGSEPSIFLKLIALNSDKIGYFSFGYKEGSKEFYLRSEKYHEGNIYKIKPINNFIGIRSVNVIKKIEISMKDSDFQNQWYKKYHKEIENILKQYFTFSDKQRLTAKSFVFRWAELSDGQRLCTFLTVKSFIRISQMLKSNYRVALKAKSRGGKNNYSKKYFDADKRILLIEEPEAGLHPELQKLLPKIFRDLLTLFHSKIQIVIATHSPFIISAAAKIAEEEFEKHKENGGSRKDFKPSQKVYQIEGGKCIDENGLWGYRSIQTSAKMLGAGFDSIVLNDKKHTPKNIFYCEGSIDAQIYSIIFPQNNGRHNVFIPCGGAQQALLNYFINSETNKITMGTNTDTLCLIDRSCKDGVFFGKEHIRYDQNNWFPDEDRTKFLDFDPNHRMLKRREIENYLFDPTVIKKSSKFVENQMCLENINSYGNVKDVNPKLLQDCAIELALIIRDMRKDQVEYNSINPEKNNIYWQLYGCIFGEG